MNKESSDPERKCRVLWYNECLNLKKQTSKTHAGGTTGASATNHSRQDIDVPEKHEICIDHSSPGDKFDITKS